MLPATEPLATEYSIRPDYTLRRRQLVPAATPEVFAFFADARNLQHLTPPWLHFEIHTPLPIEMRVGALIDYSIRWRLAKWRWRSQILDWSPPRRFIDRQLAGPYRLWEHLHTFDPHPQGTLLTDVVRYTLPLGTLGKLAHFLVVRRDLEAIFDYRQKRITDRFGPVGHAVRASPQLGRSPEVPPQSRPPDGTPSVPDQTIPDRSGSVESSPRSPDPGACHAAREVVREHHPDDRRDPHGSAPPGRPPTPRRGLRQG